MQTCIYLGGEAFLGGGDGERTFFEGEPFLGGSEGDRPFRAPGELGRQQYPEVAPKIKRTSIRNITVHEKNTKQPCSSRTHVV